MKTMTVIRFMLAAALVLLSLLARADSVGQVQTTKYFAPETVALIKQRVQDVANGVPGATLGFKAGDVVSYIIQFTPVNNGGTVGAGGYITDYIPAGVQVLNAQFVQPDGNGGFYQVSPPPPALMSDGWGPRGTFSYTPGWTSDPYTIAMCTAAGKTLANCAGSLAQLVADTGIFYSTDPRTAVFYDPSTDGRVRQWAPPLGNGYYVCPSAGAGLVTRIGGGGVATCGAPNSPTAHNLWDAAMTNAFGSIALPLTLPNAGNAIIVTTGKGAAPYNAASPVAGPDSGYQLDYTGNVGPWHRISYPGSMVGSNASGPALAIGTPTVVATPTSAGASFPLPLNTNAVRWSAGRLTVGQQSYVKISMQLLADPPASGLVNNSEVFGGDASADNGPGKGKDNPWAYAVMSVASNISTLFILKEVVCVYDASGTCVPNNGANLPATPAPKVRYRISYINTNNGTQHNVTICDQLPGNVVVPFASVTQISANPAIGTPVSPAAPACGFAAGGTTFSYPPIPVLAGGGAGIVEFDVQYPAGMPVPTVISNTAKAVSTEIPAGVVSYAPSNVVASAAANLLISKIVSPANPAKGDTVTYTVTVDNVGSAPASLTTLVDLLPGQATAVVANQAASRFNYLATGSVTVNGAPLSGVTAAVTPPVNPATVNNETVTWTFPSGTAIPAGGQLVLTFTATVGAAGPTNVMVYGTAYSNTATINCATACVVAPVAPNTATSKTTGLTASATLTIPPLTVSKSIDCVFDGVGNCAPGSYTGGAAIPVNAKLRYKLVYTNPAGAAQTITLTDTLPTQTTAAGNLYVASGPEIRPSTPALSQNPAAAGAPRGVDVALTPIAGGTVVNFAAASLPAGASGTLYLDVQTNAVAGNIVTNSCSLQSTQRAAAGGAAVACTPVQATASALTISKTAGTPTGLASGVILVPYTITVTNPGAVGVVLTSVVDTLPKPLPNLAGRTILCGDAAGATTMAACLAATTVTINGVPAAVAPTLAQTAPTATVGQVNTWTLGGTAAQKTLNPGQTMTLTFTAVYSATVLRGQSYSNTATINYTGGTASTGPTAPVAIPYNTVSVSKAATPTSAAPNSPVTYTITVHNPGTMPVPVTSVVDSLPSATAGVISYVSTTSVLVNGVAQTGVAAAPAAGQYQNPAPAAPLVGQQQQVTWNFPAAGTTQINPGQSMVITFVAQFGAIPTGVSYPNDVRVYYSGGVTPSEFAPNQALVYVPPVSKITKTIDCIYQPTCTPGSYVDGTPIPVNALIGYKIVYENLSATPASGITITDTLPTQVGANAISNLVVNGTPTAAPPNAAGGGTVTLLTGGTLPAAPASGTITFALQTTATAGAGLTNLAKMVSTQDPVGVTSQVTAQAAGGALTVSKAVTPATPSTVAQGGTVSYTITVTNTGSAAATLTSLADTLPGAPAAAPGTTSRFTYSATGAITLNNAQIAPAYTVTVTPPAAPATINKEVVTWNFTGGVIIPAGQSFKLTFTALVGTTVPKGVAAPGATYYNDVTATYTGGAFATSTAASQAPVLVPFNTLTMSKSIDCVYDAALAVCQPYVSGSPLPPNARVRYRLDYGNIAPAAQIITVKDTLPASTTAAGNLYVASGPEVRPSTPLLSQNPAAAGMPRGADAALTAIAPNTVVAMTAVSLPANTSGTLFLDVQTNALAGGSVSNCAIVTTAPADTCAAPGVGVTSSVTTPVQNVAVLQLSKSTSTPNVAPNGTVTYTLTITNTGTAATQTLKLYDFLPYSGSIVNAAKRFNYAATTGNTTGCTPTVSTSVAPTVTPYGSNLNQQQVLWDFGACAIAPGATATLTFTATVGASMPEASYYNSVRYEFTSAGIGFNGNVNGQALVTVTNPTPSLMLLKTVQVYSDPLNGVTNPKFIPGALAGYTITAVNSGTGPVDNNALFITDSIPANTALFVNDLGAPGSGPVAFAQGATSSGLTYTFGGLGSAADDLDFFGGATPAWGYVPTPGADGCDPLVQQIRVNPKGAFVGSPTAPNPSFNVQFRVCVK